MRLFFTILYTVVLFVATFLFNRGGKRKPLLLWKFGSFSTIYIMLLPVPVWLSTVGDSEPTARRRWGKGLKVARRPVSQGLGTALPALEETSKKLPEEVKCGMVVIQAPHKNRAFSVCSHGLIFHLTFSYRCAAEPTMLLLITIGSEAGETIKQFVSWKFPTRSTESFSPPPPVHSKFCILCILVLNILTLTVADNCSLWTLELGYISYNAKRFTLSFLF